MKFIVELYIKACPLNVKLYHAVKKDKNVKFL